ncbi:VOC family protein [Mammaliicoccus vitulinus]|uniref:VOC family protein n=1 Tax=Mammaliicoccus vitulinus TaxID=71237 RepID=UPI001951A16A|nr:VOC family protein [Mammaliicoccus vitulinus]MBM6628542.1 VOC family protein [Mammaliicoccus vitulinus]
MEGDIHHLEIYVDDLIKTRNFYEELLKTLGYQLYQEWENGFSFKLKGVYIVFVKVEEEYKEYDYHRKRIGLNHLAFGVKNKSEVDTITNVLINKGISILYKDKHPYAGGPEHYAVYFEDPNRIKLEIVSEE